MGGKGMSVYKMLVTVLKDGVIVIDGLPVKKGDEVEVVVSLRESGGRAADRYPLWGKPFRYDRPFDSVAEDEWITLQ